LYSKESEVIHWLTQYRERFPELKETNGDNIDGHPWRRNRVISFEADIGKALECYERAKRLSRQRHRSRLSPADESRAEGNLLLNRAIETQISKIMDDISLSDDERASALSDEIGIAKAVPGAEWDVKTFLTL
jgi:hypothetical protein